ncbi:hypothetical protein CB1_000765092 [Camelus ferus]|nr:hypothetical protein CB1_000765092 [Camelus ferus]
MLSALSPEDVRTLKQYLLAQARPGPWEFHSGVLTSQTPEEICTNIIREKLLEYLPQEVPYSVQQKTVMWDEGPNGELVIEQKLLVPKESHVRILIGPKGHLISQIAQEVGRNLMDIFLCEVRPSPQHPCYEQDCLKHKSVLLELTAALTEGVVNGKKLKRKQAFHSQPGTHAPSPAAKSPNTQSVGNPQRTGWPHFQEIFMLSALSPEDVRTLKQYLLAQARPGPWEFHSGVLTSQTPEEICTNIIREKLLEYLPQEVPYSVQQKTVMWDEGPNGELVIEQKLLVPKESHVRILIGPKGHLISQIAQEVGRNLMDIFLCEVRLRLAVKLLK